MRTKITLIAMVTLLLYHLFYSPVVYTDQEKPINKEVSSEILVYLSNINEQNKKILENQQLLFKEIEVIKIELKRIKNRL